MRFVARILVGLVATGALLAGALSAPAAAASAASPYFHDSWGAYSSTDGKAEAEGKVTVHEKKHKKGYWKKYSKLTKKCWWVKKKINGHWVKVKKCKWVKTWHKKWVWKWETSYHYLVHSKLDNDKWWGHPKFRCAWETFKIQKFDGSVHFQSFKNCTKHPKGYSFAGEGAEHIWVKVSRGNHFGPKGFDSAWEDVYHHA